VLDFALLFDEEPDDELEDDDVSLFAESVPDEVVEGVASDLLVPESLDDEAPARESVR